jgi:hypothetical protein
MARRRAARGNSRGGERIQTPRPSGARIATGIAAVAAAAALAVYPAAQDIRLHWLALSLGGTALAFVALGLVARSGGAIGWGLAALGGEYAVWFDAQGSALDEYAPLYAATFVLVAELAFWSVERRVEAAAEPDLVLWRLGYLSAVCAGAAGIGGLVLVESAAGGGGGPGLEAVGVASVIGALALVGVLVRRSGLR